MFLPQFHAPFRDVVLCLSIGLLAPLSSSCFAQTAPIAGLVTPTNWKVTDDFKSLATLSPDATSGSVRLNASSAKGGAIVTEVSGAGAGTFLVSGQIKTEGEATGIRLDLQVFDGAWHQQAWITSDDNDAHKLAPSAKARAFSRSVDFPENTAHVIAYFTMLGQGEATLRNFALAQPPHADFSAVADAKPVGVTALARVIGATLYVWKNAVIGGVKYCTNILFNPKHPEQMVSRNDTGGIYRYDRKAKKWVALMDNLPFSWSNLFVADSLALDANHPDTIYVAGGASQWSTPFDALKTVDGGKTWQRTSLKNAEGKDVYCNAGGDEKPAAERLAVDPNDSDVVFFGTRRDGLFRSQNGAKTWQAVTSFPNKGRADSGLTFVTLDWKASAPQRTRTIYVGVHGDGKAGGTVYRSQDGGATWAKLQDGFPESSSPIRGRVGLDGALYVSTSGGAGLWKFQQEQWSDITPPEGKGQSFSGIGIHPTDPKQLLTITYNEKVPVFYSKDGGATWTGYQYKTDGGGNLDIGFQPAWVANDEHFKWPTGYCSTIDFDPLNPSVAVEADFSGANTLTGIGKARATVDMLSEGREQMTIADAVSPSKGAPLVSGAWDLGGYRHTNLDEIPRTRLLLRKPDGSRFQGDQDYQNGFQDGFQLDANPNNPDVIVIAGGWQWNQTGAGAISRDNGRTLRVFASKPFPDAKFGRIAVGVNPDNIVWAPMGAKDTPLYFSKDGGV